MSEKFFVAHNFTKFGAGNPPIWGEV